MSSVDEEQVHEAFDALVNEELGLPQPVRKGEEMLHDENADTDILRMSIVLETGKLKGKRICTMEPWNAKKVMKKMKGMRNDIFKLETILPG